MSASPNATDLGRIGKYRVVGRCGAGGIGSVYRAEDDFLRRTVAIKVLQAAHRNNPTLRARFLGEIRIGAKLAHPHIAAVYDGGEVRRALGEDERTEPADATPRLEGVALEDGTIYFAQEFLAGPTLAEHLRTDGPLRYDQVPRRLGPLLDALAYMHGRGVIHRDLKPSNVHFGATLKLLDLGSAKVCDEADEHFDGVERTTGTSVPLTTSYRSPESFEAPTVYDRYFDLWSTAVILYQAVAGRLPFGSGAEGNFPAMFRRLMEGRYTPLREIDPHVPVAVEDFFARAFALRREDRFESAEAMHEALWRAFTEAPSVEESPSPAVAAATDAPVAPAASPPSQEGAEASLVSIPAVATPVRETRGRRRALALLVLIVAMFTVCVGRSLAPLAGRGQMPIDAGVQALEAAPRDAMAAASSPSQATHEVDAAMSDLRSAGADLTVPTPRAPTEPRPRGAPTQPPRRVHSPDAATRALPTEPRTPPSPVVAPAPPVEAPRRLPNLPPIDGGCLGENSGC